MDFVLAIGFERTCCNHIEFEAFRFRRNISLAKITIPMIESALLLNVFNNLNLLLTSELNQNRDFPSKNKRQV